MDKKSLVGEFEITFLLLYLGGQVFISGQAYGALQGTKKNY
jgi:hypothetical protein